MRNKNIIVLALGHGLNDLIAGFFIGVLALANNDLLKTGLAITIYNILAFGGQYPIAVFLEKTGNTKKFLVASYLLNVFAIFIFLFSFEVSIILAGIASAIYHVAGGSYCAENNKATNIGLFAAPGVAGLIAGGYLSWKQADIIPFLLPGAILFLFVLIKIKFATQAVEKNVSANTTRKHAIDTHDIIMIFLLLIISLRSVTWNVFQLVNENNFEWLIAIAIAAVAGKIAGGWLADKVGWRIYALSSAIIATPLLTFFKKELVLFCIGIGLLQSGIPATTSLLIHSLEGKTSKGIALSFGTAIIIGAAASIFPIELLLLQTPYILLISIVLLFICSYWYKRIGSYPV
jgi:MFS transporter, FSR family, fosmidomycin resistance protein